MWNPCYPRYDFRVATVSLELLSHVRKQFMLICSIEIWKEIDMNTSPFEVCGRRALPTLWPCLVPGPTTEGAPFFILL